MYSSSDFEKLWFLYKSEGEPKGISINSFCLTHMASADFSQQALLRDSEKKHPHVCETSPVKTLFFPSYTRLIYHERSE